MGNLEAGRYVISKTSDVLNNQSFEFLMMTVDSLKLFDGENSGGLVNHDGHDLIICKSTSNIVGVYSIIPIGLCCQDKLKKSISEGYKTKSTLIGAFLIIYVFTMVYFENKILILDIF